jgi:hypothetical protein
MSECKVLKTHVDTASDERIDIYNPLVVVTEKEVGEVQHNVTLKLPEIGSIGLKLIRVVNAALSVTEVCADSEEGVEVIACSYEEHGREKFREGAFTEGVGDTVLELDIETGCEFHGGIRLADLRESIAGSHQGCYRAEENCFDFHLFKKFDL